MGIVLTDLEELHEIVELTVDVTADGDWAADWLYVRFLREDLLCLYKVRGLVCRKCLWDIAIIVYLCD
jgi:hypothetical protein